MDYDDAWSLVWLCVVIGLITWSWQPAADRISGRLTGYPAVCVDVREPATAQQCVEWRAVDPIVFAVLPDQQLVVVKRASGVTRLSECVVLDRVNWECGEYFAADGRIGRPWLSPSELFLSRWRWYALKYVPGW
jgi:hypothetical protein